MNSSNALHSKRLRKVGIPRISCHAKICLVPVRVTQFFFRNGSQLSRHTSRTFSLMPAPILGICGRLSYSPILCLSDLLMRVQWFWNCHLFSNELTRTNEICLCFSDTFTAIASSSFNPLVWLFVFIFAVVMVVI